MLKSWPITTKKGVLHAGSHLPPPPDLADPAPLTAGPVHRYSFNGNANDSVGGAHGTLVDNTGSSSYANGQLVLGNTGSENSANNTGDYVDLPNGIISALADNGTFETWTTWEDTGAYWQRIFDFGTSNGGEDVSVGSDNSTYLFMTPRGGTGHFAGISLCPEQSNA